MNPRLLALFLAAAGAAYTADHEFDRVVSAVEKHYGVKRTHIPLMGLANFVLKVSHPAGTSGVKIAIFEDLPSPSGPDELADLDRFMDRICEGRLHPLVVTRSRAAGESAYILTGEVGKSTRMLIATFERHEATVIEATVSIETLMKMMASPAVAHLLFQNNHDDGDGGR